MELLSSSKSRSSLSSRYEKLPETKVSLQLAEIHSKKFSSASMEGALDSPVKTLQCASKSSDFLRVNALVCGVEMVSSCAFAYIPPLMLKSGFSETSMTIILGLAPFIDMCTVPSIAEWSDHCTSSLGRRRPFIIALSCILIVSLILIPYSNKLTLYITGIENSNLSMFTLAIGVVLLDYSYQALFNPCECLLSDMTTSLSEFSQTLGFTIYSACVSLGCILGYLIVGVDWVSYFDLGLSQAQLSFSVILTLFFPCLLLTLSTKESVYKLRSSSPDVNLENNLKYSELSAEGEKSSLLKDLPIDPGYESGNSDIEDNSIRGYHFGVRQFARSVRYSLFSYQSTVAILKRLGSFMRGFVKCIIFIPYKAILLPYDCYRRISNSPNVIRRLFLAELFAWTGLMCHNMFFTDFVGQYIYGGFPDADETSAKGILYDEGVRMGSRGLFLHSLIACLYAFLIQRYLVRKYGHRMVFLGGLSTFALCMVLTPLAQSIIILNVITALSGLGFAALTSTPNMLVTMYNSKRKLYMWDTYDSNKKQFQKGLASDVATLDMAYFLSQIILSICVGPIVELFMSPLPYMIISAIAGCASIYFASKVVFNVQQLSLVQMNEF